MALIIKGGAGSQLQPDSQVSIDRDGLMSGTATFDGSEAAVLGNVPTVGVSLHPKDPRLVCESISTTYKRLGKASITANYIGLASDPTTPRIEFAGGSGQDPIETHPDFIKFAGTPGDPKNNARFDEETGEFLGFFAGVFQGVTAYVVPSIIVNYTYYTTVAPNVKRVGRVVGNLPEFNRPPNVKNYLLIAMPYRQIANVYAVTEQYLGSGEKGWNGQIY
jgi:hypothetical protein